MSSYGFEDDLPEINLPKPKSKRPKPEPEVMDKAVEAGRGLGFVSRDPSAAKAPPPPKRKGGRRPSKEPLDKIFISGPQRVTDAFRDYCERNDMSYWEALDHLMKEAGN
tara:strand:+ start:345 stop:671 length:327 start_codon:yes stop_codon:yes gene_type:complete